MADAGENRPTVMGCGVCTDEELGRYVDLAISREVSIVGRQTLRLSAHRPDQRNPVLPHRRGAKRGYFAVGQSDHVAFFDPYVANRPRHTARRIEAGPAS